VVTSTDPDGNLLTSIDPAGHETFNVYNAEGERTSTTVGYGTPAAATTAYTYG